MRAAASAGSQPACPLGVCDGSGWILGPEDVARACECRERTIARARLRGLASVIPAKYRGVSFDRPPVTEIAPDVVQPVREYCAEIDEMIDSRPRPLVLRRPGTGKTTLAMLVSKTALERGRSVAIYSMPKLLARIRRTYDAGAGEQSYAELFERLATVDLLHIDDLGAENRTEWVLEQLYSLINERYESRARPGRDHQPRRCRARGAGGRAGGLAAGRHVRDAAPVRRGPAPAPGRPRPSGEAPAAPPGGALGPLDH